jgi:hypothetical protein
MSDRSRLSWTSSAWLFEYSYPQICMLRYMLLLCPLTEKSVKQSSKELAFLRAGFTRGLQSLCRLKSMATPLASYISPFLLKFKEMCVFRSLS